MAQASLLSPENPAVAIPAVTGESLGEYIATETARLLGPQLPNYRAGEIIAGFCERFGADAMAICRQVFDVHNGMWRGAPVTILRFQEHHDEYFAYPLLQEVRSAQDRTE
jgi:hypothetical protein